MQNFDFSIFAKKNYLEVVLPTSKYKKMDFLDDFEHFWPWKFFSWDKYFGL